MKKQVTGKVARVLNSQSVVLNRGGQHGLKNGDYIGVLDDEFSVVIDPEDDKEIGDIIRFKISLRVTQLSDSLAVASTYRVRNVNRGGHGTSFNRVFEEPRWVEEVEQMNVVQGLASISGKSSSVVTEGDEFRVVSKEVADAGFMI